ncbi:hypothetical protein BAY60_11380 [Prauserella muralis]|uniref:DUF6801 domain-containing protein n=2 Tax=Prauserella muralis TaxID=588067 RepID=A0A2V4AYN2_9PSEU|nr:hypothetical protein BAY60_11380 [Prauserella muralis]
MLAAAATAGAIALSGVAGTGVASGRQAATELVYTCQFPSGEVTVPVGISATFPGEAHAGEPIQPGAVAVTLTVPEQALPEPAPATLTATAGLTVAVTQNGNAAESAWAGLGVPPTPVPAAGAVVLSAAGDVPPVTVHDRGEVTFSAAALVVEVVPYAADGAAAEPWTVPCAPAPDADRTLAVVPVAGGQPGSTPPATEGPTSVEPGDGADDGNVIDTPPASRDRRAQADPLAPGEAPPGCFDFPTDLPNPSLMCAYVTGYANVTKLGAAVRLGVPEPGFAQILLNEAAAGEIRPCDTVSEEFVCTYAIFVRSRATMDFPAAGTSMLTFGFVPVSGKVRLRLAEPYLVIDSVTERHDYPRGTPDKFPVKVTAQARMWLELSDVRVNGVPLDVGDDCRSAEPIDVVLAGGSANTIPQNPDEYTVPFGGVLSGSVDIPPFSGCGATEDLDPLLTGTISGPDNDVKVTQGRPCPEVGGATYCPPEVPEPRR